MVMKHILLPRELSNRYEGPKVLTILFALVTLMTLARSLAHIFLPDGGANSIASMISFDGDPDPDPIIYHLFALWGLAQLAMGVVYGIVLVRYRALMPLMWLFIAVEYAMRLVLGLVLKPLGDQYFLATAPGEIGNYVLLPLALIALGWSIHHGKKTQ